MGKSRDLSIIALFVVLVNVLSAAPEGLVQVARQRAMALSGCLILLQLAGLEDQRDYLLSQWSISRSIAYSTESRSVLMFYI